MRRGSGHLLRLGALALAAALVAAAAWTYSGHSDSSVGRSAQASESLGRFSIPGLSGKGHRAHGDQRGGGAPQRRTQRAARSGLPKPVPAISRPVPAPRPVSTDMVSTNVVDAPERPPEGHEPSVPRPAPRQPEPAPRQPGPAPREPKPAPRQPKPAPPDGAPTGGAPDIQPSDPVAPPTDPVSTPAPAPTAPDPAGDTDPGLDDTPVGGLDPGDLGGPIDETPDPPAPGAAASAA